MNPEIHTILEDMKPYFPKAPGDDQRINRYISIQIARLHVLLAEEAEKQSKKMMVLTWSMFALSFALLMVGIIPIVKP